MGSVSLVARSSKTVYETEGDFVSQAEKNDLKFKSTIVINKYLVWYIQQISKIIFTTTANLNRGSSGHLLGDGNLLKQWLELVS